MFADILLNLQTSMGIWYFQIYFPNNNFKNLKKNTLKARM